MPVDSDSSFGLDLKPCFSGCLSAMSSSATAVTSESIAVAIVRSFYLTAFIAMKLHNLGLHWHLMLCC